MPDRRPAYLAVSLVLAALAGCAGSAPRASVVQLDQDATRAFRRAYDAERRMTTGRADEQLISQVWASCRPLEREPPADRRWRWSCQVGYLALAPIAWMADRGQATYLVRVDRRGCFSASSTDYPQRVYELILRRRSPNPLARFVSCPDRPADPV
ncbi:MAG TPA: hypothetical protein VHI73_02740 [Solirubrobacteraceae bacterium]|jgi:hypothetical protein|nr:hypothetical protein [Solirubrobacteraceae bacterium]